MCPKFTPLVQFVLLSLLMALSGTAMAEGYYANLHDTSDRNETTGTAIAVAAPSQDNGRIRVHRIRITSSSSTALSFQFRAARKTDSVGDTQTMVAWSCVLPACSDVYTIEGITAGQLYDFQDLNLKLLPGERLYLYTNADIAADYYSAAVFWEEE